MCLKLFTLRSDVSFADLEQTIEALKLLNLSTTPDTIFTC